MKSTKFITDNFILQSDIAEKLYHEYAKDLPIIDYHNHLSPQKIAENQPVKNITDAWLEGDHYKWRAMRANGIEEIFITGSATSKKEKFLKWAETVPYTLRNPLFHWTHLELKRYFSIDDVLQPSTAEDIYVKANETLESKTPAQLLEDMKVEVICTTDDPIDDLKYHKEIAEKDFYTKVFPTFRPDALLFIKKENFITYINKLSTCVGFPITSLEDLIKAIEKRVEYFDEAGCRLSDYGMEEIYATDFTEAEADDIFKKRLSGSDISNNDVKVYASCVLDKLCKMYHKKRWTQQFHVGAIRNNNDRLLNQIGLDAGVDSIGDFPAAKAMSRLFNRLDSTNQLAKTISYNLNPSQNEVFATMMGNYNEGGVPGKMQWGSGWWFLDQKDGMEKQINCLSNMGLLSRFVGMLTDSRSFLSFTRHEYFRRILCNIIGEDVKQGLVPNDIEFLGKMVQDICYYNAKNYFGFDITENK
ncbi:glucuronate isomerase [Hyunsoonleella pacifica]|uniref:Uronate isomerase n=1 Tax=Hyunsoonleella pacifica TaxID=1080224 RepID=A0A4Q9FJG2_9FLAO|nr:glucuronate isomerase [Hyunsoonleella pacifica]TBN13091.1 glucuronate isomerase [Hyunsoonleella pacifica]GGD27216.1 uronate isomerase [Hyunsoonleella pacifica]